MDSLDAIAQWFADKAAAVVIIVAVTVIMLALYEAGFLGLWK